eukprot:scpid89034/ scgid13338/ 
MSTRDQRHRVFEHADTYGTGYRLTYFIGQPSTRGHGWKTAPLAPRVEFASNENFHRLLPENLDTVVAYSSRLRFPSAWLPENNREDVYTTISAAAALGRESLQNVEGEQMPSVPTRQACKSFFLRFFFFSKKTKT